MLQFITHPSPRWSIAEEVQMAIEGGCGWVQLRMKDATDAEVRAVAEEIIPLCKESDTILVIDDRVELVNELKVSGVHLGKTDMPPAEARELLGPHAIIGVTCNTVDDILALRGLDVDYMGLGPLRSTSTKQRLAPLLGLEGLKALVDARNAAGIEIPAVAIGGITAADIEAVMATGVEGVAVSGAIVGADDPVAATAHLINLLNKTKQR